MRQQQVPLVPNFFNYVFVNLQRFLFNAIRANAFKYGNGSTLIYQRYIDDLPTSNEFQHGVHEVVIGHIFQLAIKNKQAIC